MGFRLDYDNIVNLDAEDLAEGGIKQAYESIQKLVGRYVPEPAEVREAIDSDAPSYAVTCGSQNYVIYSPSMPDEEGEIWEGLPTRFSGSSTIN